MTDLSLSEAVSRLLAQLGTAYPPLSSGPLSSIIDLVWPSNLTKPREPNVQAYWVQFNPHEINGEGTPDGSGSPPKNLIHPVPPLRGTASRRLSGLLRWGGAVSGGGCGGSNLHGLEHWEAECVPCREGLGRWVPGSGPCAISSVFLITRWATPTEQNPFRESKKSTMSIKKTVQQDAQKYPKISSLKYPKIMSTVVIHVVIHVAARPGRHLANRYIFRLTKQDLKLHPLVLTHDILCDNGSLDVLGHS